MAGCVVPEGAEDNACFTELLGPKPHSPFEPLGESEADFPCTPNGRAG